MELKITDQRNSKTKAFCHVPTGSFFFHKNQLMISTGLEALSMQTKETHKMDSYEQVIPVTKVEIIVKE